MLDVGHLPKRRNDWTSIFTRVGTVANFQWHTWIKPRGASMLYIMCVGGGGGGGGGFTAAAGSARGGGGSGGSAAATRVLIPMMFIPDALYIEVGMGGQGRLSGGGTADSGLLSRVTIAPDLTASNCLAVSGTAVAGGGVTGTAGSGGAGGGAGSVAAIGAMPLAGMGFFAFIGGVAGVAGGSQAGAVGAATAIPVTSALTQGGSGGAGTTSADFAGGLFTAIAGSWLSQQRSGTPAAGTTGHGSGGRNEISPFFSWGGGGGSSSNTAAGAGGGNGHWGSGAGGGGGGTTGGRGGNGGGGVVILCAW